MAELKSHEVLAKPKFKLKKQSFYDERSLISKNLSVFSPLNEDGYRTASSFGGGAPGYIYYYYITCPIEFTVEIYYSNESLKLGNPYVEYGATDHIYFAKVQLEVFDKITDSDVIEFVIEWKEESSTRIVMQECVLLAGIFDTDYLRYHLLHPYYYKHDQDLLLTIVDDDNTKSSRQIKWDKEGFITDPFEDRFLYQNTINYISKRKEIQVFKNEKALSSFQLTYID